MIKWGIIVEFQLYKDISVAKPIGNHSPFAFIDLYESLWFYMFICLLPYPAKFRGWTRRWNSPGGFVSAVNRAIASLHRLQGVEPETCWRNSYSRRIDGESWNILEPTMGWNRLEDNENAGKANKNMIIMGLIMYNRTTMRLNHIESWESVIEQREQLALMKLAPWAPSSPSNEFG